MKSQIFLSMLLGAAGGAIGGIVATSTTSPSGSESDLGATVEIAQLRTTLDEVQSANSDLRHRLEMLENKPTIADAPTRIDADPSKGEAAELTPELAQLAASLKNPEAKLPENLRQEISNVYSEIKAAEEAKRKEDQKKRDLERLEERLTEMAKEMGLNPFQVNEMRRVLMGLEDKRNEFRDAMRDGNNMDWDKARTAMEQLRTDTKNELARFLNGDQIKTYEEKYSNNRGFGGFGGGRGPGGGGGGRGPGGNGGAQGGPTGSAPATGNGG